MEVNWVQDVLHDRFLFQVSLGFGLRRASDEESIGDEKEMANPQRQRMDRGADRGKIGAGGKKIPIAVLSDHHNRNGEQVQPETKSDIVWTRNHFAFTTKNIISIQLIIYYVCTY